MHIDPSSNTLFVQVLHRFLCPKSSKPLEVNLCVRPAHGKSVSIKKSGLYSV